MPEISRWLSAATPPDTVERTLPHPGGMPEVWLTVGHLASVYAEISAIPPGWADLGNLQPVVSLLNHRLISVTPAGVGRIRIQRHPRTVREMCMDQSEAV